MPAGIVSDNESDGETDGNLDNVPPVKPPKPKSFWDIVLPKLSPPPPTEPKQAPTPRMHTLHVCKSTRASVAKQKKKILD